MAGEVLRRCISLRIWLHFKAKIIYFETLQGERGLNGREVTLWDGVRLVDDGCCTKIVRD